MKTFQKDSTLAGIHKWLSVDALDPCTTIESMHINALLSPAYEWRRPY